MTEDTPISAIEDARLRRRTLPATRAVRPAALDGCSFKIVGWRPVTGEA